MNPLTNIKNLNKLNENEIKMGNVGTKTSWHNQYRDSAWCFYGGMPFELTEGDIICIFEQYGAVVNINLIRDKKTGKSKGFGFICYENQLSTDLAVDNFNGTQIIGRTIKVDHAGNYRPPKDHDDADEVTKFLRDEGCSVKTIEEKKDLIASALLPIKQCDIKKEKEENRLDDFKDKNDDRHRSKEYKISLDSQYRSHRKRDSIKDDDDDDDATNKNKQSNRYKKSDRRRTRSRSVESSHRSVDRRRGDNKISSIQHEMKRDRSRDRNNKNREQQRERSRSREKVRDHYRSQSSRYY